MKILALKHVNCHPPSKFSCIGEVCCLGQKTNEEEEKKQKPTPDLPSLKTYHIFSFVTMHFPADPTGFKII